MNYDKTYYEYNEKEIRELLLYRKVVEVRGNTLVLDNGTELTFEGNEGCPGCGNGWYSVTELNECDNVITNVEFVCDNDTKTSMMTKHRTRSSFTPRISILSLHRLMETMVTDITAQVIHCM